jgi:hypothetical protein
MAEPVREGASVPGGLSHPDNNHKQMIGGEYVVR